MKLTHQTIDGKDAWRIVPTMGAFDFWTTITDMDAYKCHDYSYDLVFERKQVGVNVVLDDSAGVSLLAYCCKNFLHLLVMSDLKQLVAALGLKLPRMTSYMGFVEELLKQGGLDDADRDRMLELARARLAKRSRKATKKAAEPGVAEDEDEEDGGGDGDEEGDDVVEGNPFVKSLPETEVAFAFSKIAAGMALGEEEDDEGLDHLAKAAVEKKKLDDVDAHPLPKKPRQMKSVASSSSSIPPSFVPGASASSSSSSSAMVLPATTPHLGSEGQPPLPPPVSEPSADVQRRVLLAEAVRVPSLEPEEAPPGCPFGLFPGAAGAETMRWIARLPPGEPPFEGTRSKTQSFALGESGNREKMVCLKYLQRWWASKSAAQPP